ncbi:MAG: glyoxylate/hydroxypyruvate reductase A [Burkholderiaceae bacterium]|nr:glyoxylate/hydroxypyruvate reductase A [Burkholderiaceae bacterium]
MKTRIVVTHSSETVRQRWGQELRRHLDADVVPCDVASAPAPVRADYAIGWRPHDDFFKAVTGLKAYFSTGAGVDFLMRHPGFPATVPIVRLENAGMGVQMAEYCLHAVLRSFRLAAEYEAQQREGVWRTLEPPARDTFTIGVFGIGVLGSEVARHLRAFGFPVLAFSRGARSEPGVECISGEERLPEFLARCRVLILLAPLTPATADLFDAKRFAMLPRGAWLINVARGGLVVEEDLVAAIDAGQLAGATLDVFRTEPLPPGHPFWSHPKVRVTPHVSARTLVAESARQVADKILLLESGKPVGGVVDRTRGY